MRMRNKYNTTDYFTFCLELETGLNLQKSTVQELSPVEEISHKLYILFDTNLPL